MSFSSGVKEDLTRARCKNARQRLSVLSGLTLTCGALRISRGLGVVYTTESVAVGKCVLALAGSLYETESAIELVDRERRRAPLAVVTLHGGQCERLLLDTGVLTRTPDGGHDLIRRIPPETGADEECARAFLRGAFLGSGSCTNPRRSYHLEIVAFDPAFADQLSELIRSFSVDARSVLRRGRPVVYVRGSDVTGFLALIGASAAALEVESVRTEKDFRNYVNRKSNCETANIGKTVDAGLMQLNAIETIESAMSLERLPAPLYEAARLRLQHPDATLQELADLAEIGKSGMNHRMTRLIRMAEEIRNG